MPNHTNHFRELESDATISNPFKRLMSIKNNFLCQNVGFDFLCPLINVRQVDHVSSTLVFDQCNIYGKIQGKRGFIIKY